MTNIGIDAIGLVAHYSTKGDWAFNLAFYLAQRHEFQLNVFNFLESPYSISRDTIPSEICLSEETLADERHVSDDRVLREYYDDLLGDYVNVGFKVCRSARHNLELRRCLKEKDYQLLIIPYLEPGIGFGNMSVEEFAYRFISPVILVGPDQPNQYFLNERARMIIDNLEMPFQSWKMLAVPTEFQALPVI